tara:strand:- start:823 stop:1725 length:903 start_codon:yes stop_codon:yes gene_type:complete
VGEQDMASSTPVDRRPPASGSTRLAAVVGSPVRHSLSPTLLNAAFAATGLDWTFTAFEVAEGDLARALDGMRALGLAGLSVTMPHKAAAAESADELTDAAARLGAVNCLVPDGSRLVGHNTDGGGFLDGLAHDAGITVEGRSVLVVGAGGAARAVVEACGTGGAADIAVLNRTPERAQSASELAGGVGRVVAPDAVEQALARADLVVNATPVGMSVGPAGDMPVDADVLRVGQVAVDLVYHPLETPWLAALRRRGIEAHGGLSMLLFQAARAFSLWTGDEAPVAAMEAAARAALSARPAD